ncbi:MAG: hypothetical protein N3B01_08150 [Verrucomicrobiae bacterium]|nr:hypothetical protein [Verrucomicrobiae bacterium]
MEVHDFNLAITLECGQTFRWHRTADGWFEGVVQGRLRRVRQSGGRLEGDVDPHYFALDVSLRDIAATFPPVPMLRTALRRYWGLRVLRQQPWETLASFILSSAKQIPQIQQVVELLARRFGEPIGAVHFAFPTPQAIARASRADLHACKVGFRAPYLQEAARRVADGRLDLSRLALMEYQRAKEELLKLPGVGEKIADCVLLFSCGHNQAFPVDVWMKRVLKRLKRKVCFGPYAGWAQQYLYHAERQRRQALHRRPKTRGHSLSFA